MNKSDKNRPRRRCSVATNSDGYYTEYNDQENNFEHNKTPPKQTRTETNKCERGTRRSTRKITPNKKFNEDFEAGTQISPNKNRRSERNVIKASENIDSGSSDHSSNESRVDNAENLFEELVDVEGKQLYGFNTPKKRGGMVVKALSAPKTPSSTTLSNGKSECKTPKHVRKITKAEISKLLVDSSESDFSADESEYDPEESSQSSIDDGSEESLSDIEKEERLRSAATRGTRRKINLPSLASKCTRSSVKKIEEYIPQSDGYFKSYANKKVITSDHTLGRLKNPRLAHAELFSLLASLKLSREHERCLSDLLKEYKTFSGKWMHVMNEGFNILLYGLGSKRKLLQTFHSEILHDQPVVVVNGFFPSLTIKDVLDGITHEILDLTSSSSNLHEVVDLIKLEFSKIPDTHLFLIVHNIDGPLLRNNKAQDILSRLAAVPNIHLVASIDHINTPLLWDHLKLSNYNFSWWDVTTMLPYADETSFENSLMVQNSGDLALSSMNNVFLSLTTNARKIYMLIADQQLKNKNNNSYQGIPFKDLYWLSRESFLVSSDLALRAQLTEFLDHKLVKSRRTADGTEHLKIPIASDLLQQFYEQQS